MSAKVSFVALVVFLTQSLRVIAICEVDPASEPFQVFDEMFSEILGDSPTLELLHNSSKPAEFHEGPVYYSNGQNSYLMYTTQPPADYTDENVEPQITIQQYDIASDTIATFRNASFANMPNGQSKDLDGKLLTCEQGFRDTAPGRITRTDMSTGEVEVVIDSYYGRKFNSPNDVVMKSDGTIWFTDPEYGYQQAFKPSPEIGSFLYRYDPEGPDPKLTIVADDFERPNGLAFSPSEDYLYVSDSGAIQGSGPYRTDLPHHIRRFEVHDNKYLRNSELFAITTECVNVAEGVMPGIPDGIKVDICGNVYVSGGDGVEVFNPDGALIGKILLGRGSPNLVFGGKYGNELYILADVALYRVSLKIQGAMYSDVTSPEELITKDQCPQSSSPQTSSSLSSMDTSIMFHSIQVLISLMLGVVLTK
uniref:Gluconolactonase-like protein 569 n=1 Tax=Saccoglossus kowalevskii TaxID=10224 RepID=A0A1L7H7I3_SACKO|nr:gluconolactonase-like protein 569 [Saccoglossus kowalevskii]